MTASDPGARTEHFDPRRPLDAELALTVDDGFTLAAAGDLVISRPISQQPAVAPLLELLRGADAVYGNLETVLVDFDRFTGAPHAWQEDWPLSCEPAAAADLKAIGFDLLSRANNHALDWGPEGMRETSRLLDDQGLTHAGAGETLAQARRARFCETPKGRVGLVSCTTSFRETMDALDQCGAAPGRPGVSALALKRSIGVGDAIFESLVQVREALAVAGITAVLGEFKRGGATPAFRYEMHEAQLESILRQVRQGKQYADLLVVALHSHEGLTSPDPALPDWAPALPAAFVSEFGRGAIDAGADAVVVTGIHHLGPIEIYRRRPILAGLGNFIWSDVQTPLSADVYEHSRTDLRKAFEHPDRATDADLTTLMNNPYFAHEEAFLSVVAELRFAAGGLSELLLHPVEMGYGDPLSRSGVPRIAGPGAAQRIFERLAAISAARGTRLRTSPDPARGTIVASVEL